MKQHLQRFSLASAIFLYFLAATPARGQLSPDGTLPTNVTKSGTLFEINGGKTVGENLFHSFGQFSVPTGNTAYFNNALAIHNIISRVTGVNASQIDGLIKANGSANLFLINPNGIIFGPNAKLDIGGSFVASTASALKFADGTFFSTQDTTAPPLLTLSVPIGLQWGTHPGGSIVNAANLGVKPGQNLTLMGGTVASTGQIAAPNGQIAVVTVPGSGVYSLDRPGQLLSDEVPTASLKTSSLSLAQLLDSSGYKTGLSVSGDKKVQLVGSSFAIESGDIVAQNVSGKDATLSAAGNLTLAESQLATTRNLNLFALNTVRVRDSLANPFIAKAGGDLTIQGNRGIDILALHSTTPFQSGGNTSLRSDGAIYTDAHFASGGNFTIRTLAGAPGNFISRYDPIFTVGGDYSVGDYTGVSLEVTAGGNISYGAVTINGLDPAVNPTNPAFILKAGGTITGTGDISTTVPEGKLLVDFQAGGDIRTQGITTLGGTINLSSTNGAITANGVLDSTSDSGDGGAIALNANKDITTGNLWSYSTSSFGSGGSITLTSNAGSINTSAGKLDSGAEFGNGSAIDISAKGDITTMGMRSDGGTFGVSGNIKLTSDSGTVFVNGGEIDSKNYGTAKGGNIDITANAGSIFLSNGAHLIASTASESGGDAGKISLQAANEVSLNNAKISNEVEEGAIGNGNEIYIQARSVSLTNGAQMDASSSGRGVPGTITVIAPNSVSLAGKDTAIENTVKASAQSSTDASSQRDISIFTGSLTLTDGAHINSNTYGTGDAGIVYVRAGDVYLKNNSYLDSSTFGKGDAGAAIVQADRLVSLDNSRIFSNVESGAVGNGGYIQIEASSISLTNGTELQTQSLGTGNAGYVALNAYGSVTLDNSLITSSVKSGVVGNGGYIEIEGGSISLKNGAELQTQTQGKGDAGYVDLQARGGSISLDNSSIFSSVESGGIGNGGYIQIDSGSLSLSNGAQLQTLVRGSSNDGKPGGQGDAGAIGITANQLSIEDGAQVNADNQGLGYGGGITVAANRVVLDNQGKLTAATASGGGGNIKLWVRGDALLMRRNSLISANAGGSGDGGNITIDSPFIVAVTQEDSDITARGFKGKGGYININSEGIYGLKFRPFLTPKSDITVSSDFGLNGTVEINTPGIDPSQGLSNLPTGIVKVEGLVRQSCRPSTDDERGRFVITGKGGLPSSPTDVLNSDRVEVDLGNPSVPPSRKQFKDSNGVRDRTSNTTQNTPRLVEAQGWFVNAKGQVVLTDKVPAAKPHQPWQKTVTCDRTLKG